MFLFSFLDKEAIEYIRTLHKNQCEGRGGSHSDSVSPGNEESGHHGPRGYIHRYQK